MITEGPLPQRNWRLSSWTHHEVYTDGSSWLKVARDTSHMARGEVETDARVLSALGWGVGLTQWTDGRIAHRTPHMGDPCTAEEYDPVSILAWLRGVWARITPETGPQISDASNLVDRTRRKIEIRVQDPDVQRMLLNRLPDQISPNHEGWGLCHTDPHVGNILSRPDGFVVLDWESALYGPSELDAVGVALSLWNSGRREDAVAVINDREAAAPLITTKATSGASWAWANVGPEHMWERLQAGDDLLAAL